MPLKLDTSHLSSGLKELVEGYDFEAQYQPLEWGEFYWQAFLRATEFWDADTVGAYVRLLGYARMNRGIIPADPSILRSICRVKGKRWKPLWSVIEPKFERLLIDSRVFLVNYKMFSVVCSEAEKRKLKSQNRGGSSPENPIKSKGAPLRPSNGRRDGRRTTVMTADTTAVRRGQDITRQDKKNPPQPPPGGAPQGTMDAYPDWDELERLCREAAGWTNHPSVALIQIGEVDDWLKAGADLHHDVLPTLKRLAPRCRTPNWKFFRDAVFEAMARRSETRAMGEAARSGTAPVANGATAAAGPGEDGIVVDPKVGHPSTWDAKRWSIVAAMVVTRGRWDESFQGPRPGPGCLMPEELITDEVRRAARS